MSELFPRQLPPSKQTARSPGQESVNLANSLRLSFDAARTNQSSRFNRFPDFVNLI